MNDKIKSLTEAALVLITAPTWETNAYLIMKEVERRVKDIVKNCYEEGYRQRDAELIIQSIKDN